jgi:hypothetical protein
MTVAVILVKGFPYVALQHLCHQSVSGAPDGGDLLENGTAFSATFKCSFQSINLTPDTANRVRTFFSSGVLGIAYLTALYFLY